MEDLLNFAHRAYVRLEAVQLIQDCLALEEVGPFNKMVETLVLDGPSSIYLMREVLKEVQAAKSNLSQEGLGVRHDLMEALGEFDVKLPNLLSANATNDFRDKSLQSRYLKSSFTAAKLDTEEEALLLEIWSEAGEREIEITGRLSFVNQLEEIIRDWIGSMAYEIMRSGQGSIDFRTMSFRQ